MASNNSRKFSLDKQEVDPEISNRIMSADGDESLGSWNGELIHDLMKELDRIEEYADANYSALPHQVNIPNDLRAPGSVDFPIWTCDSNGLCLAGEYANKIVSVEEIRAYYKSKHGGTERFIAKVQQEIRERNKRLANK